jgi:hypothetical protein
MAGEILRPFPNSSHADHEQPLVPPQVLHFRQVPLRTSVKFPHSPQLSPLSCFAAGWVIAAGVGSQQQPGHVRY